MKTIIFAILLVIVITVLVQMKGTEIKYIKEDVTSEVIKEEPKEKWQMDEDAIKAAKDVIKKKELQAELEKLDIEIKEKQEKRKQITAELTTYWRDKARIKQIIRQVFKEDADVAIAVAMAESGLNPYALNAKDSHSGCNGSYGIFQIGCLHETDPSKLYDVEYNIRRAKEIYDDSGWKPWGAFTNKSYQSYLAIK